MVYTNIPIRSPQKWTLLYVLSHGLFGGLICAWSVIFQRIDWHADSFAVRKIIHMSQPYKKKITIKMVFYARMCTALVCEYCCVYYKHIRKVYPMGQMLLTIRKVILIHINKNNSRVVNCVWLHQRPIKIDAIYIKITYRWSPHHQADCSTCDG